MADPITWAMPISHDRLVDLRIATKRSPELRRPQLCKALADSCESRPGRYLHDEKFPVGLMVKTLRCNKYNI